MKIFPIRIACYSFLSEHLSFLAFSPPINYTYTPDLSVLLSFYDFLSPINLMHFLDLSGKMLSNCITGISKKSIRMKFGTPIEDLTPIEKWGLFFSFVDDAKKADYVSKLVRNEQS